HGPPHHRRGALAAHLRGRSRRRAGLSRGDAQRDARAAGGGLRRDAALRRRRPPRAPPRAPRAPRAPEEYRRVLAESLGEVNRLIRVAEDLLLLTRAAPGRGLARERL